MTRPTVEAELLSDRQVAALLGCSARHILNLAQRRVLPRPIRLGRVTRWRRSDILAAIAELHVAAQAEGGSATHA